MNQIAFANEKELVTQHGDKTISETILRSARFDLKDIKEGRYNIVGHINLRRRFSGTRAIPPYHDGVQFSCFSGDDLKFSTFKDPELESSLLKLLANGRSLPVVITVRFERIRVGHDGINMSDRLVAHIEECKPTTTESIFTTAEAAGFGAADFLRFKTALKPDFVKDGIAVTLGKVSARSKVTPRGVALSIHGIRVFNTTAKIISIEITELTIQQDSVQLQCVRSKKSQAPHSWQVKAASWSDGVYEKGKMPRILWMFDPSGTIKPRKKVTVQLKLKLNSSKTVILTRTIDPL